MQLDAPIVAVTVHPQRARVTRRGRVTVPAGTSEVVVADLPLSVVEESVRVTGRSAGDTRVIGVDLVYRDLAVAPDEQVRAAEGAVRAAEREVAVVDGADSGDAARATLLNRLASRSGDRLAAALADGTAEPGRVAEVASTVAAQLVEVAASRRGNAERRVDALRELEAARAELSRLTASGRTRRQATIGIEAAQETELELDLIYVADGAGWSPAYDARLDDTGKVTLTWYGMVAQGTGESWPACELTLSTARPAVSSTVPELDPWWVDVHRPIPMPAPARQMAGYGEAFDGMVLRAAAPAGAAEKTNPGIPVAAFEATAVSSTIETAVSASWRLPRPVAVPSDSTPHRTTITTLTFDAELDHVVAPALSNDAHLRATITNTSEQVLLAGPVSAFLADSYVGTTAIEQTAPGAEIELALGVDPQVVVERKLAERTTRRARFTSTRGAAERWTTTVANRRATATKVSVRDRLPVSRHSDVSVVDVVITPEPAERDDLGRFTWQAALEPQATWTGEVRYAVEHPKDTPLTGWS
ncbi:mucoidy inhibitor MuiA family protein [Pseudonocardia sp. TRM90224]|uniref:mucoidy inhibitor MuiA family protein n=1 Tax=Pseudonocardia sp. TRM90224 TaxID=2812678 RepID=UPI001E28635B|nr:mucoidy inhibitor MuiA family protein [Pseudonocardia sp. TRM90224]